MLAHKPKEMYYTYTHFTSFSHREGKDHKSIINLHNLKFTPAFNVIHLFQFPELSVLDPIVFYPIHFNKRMHYFESGTVKFAKTYGHHLWSSLSIGMEAPEKSILAQLAKRSCPTTFELFKDSFGS